MARKIAQNDSSEDGSSSTSLEVRFAQCQSQLNDRRRQLIRDILDNPEESYFLSSRELARRYNVDAATIVRTVQALGYERFADFAADLRRHFVTRITPYTIMRATAREKRSPVDHVNHSLERDAENLNLLRSTLDPHRVTELAKLIHRSRRIVVVGTDLATTISWFFAYSLTAIGFDAEAPVASTGNLQHKIDVLTGKDLVVGISFGRCLRDTVESLERASERGVPTFGITDSDTTPIAIHCDSYLVASIASSSVTGSYVAPIALTNAILVACAHIEPRRSLSFLRRTEEEYKTGRRWYQEPQRRSRSSDDTARRAGKK
jgi:DNA-binding MurR/RpiR family transcriptional regulator